MINNIYGALLLMSAIGGALYLLFRLVGKFTAGFFSERWHYYSSIVLYSFFILPYYKLLSLLDIRLDPVQTLGQREDFKYVKDFALNNDINPIPGNPIILQKKYMVPQIIHRSELKYINLIPYILICGTILSVSLILIKNYRIKQSILKTCKLNTNKETAKIFLNCKKQINISKDIPIYISPYIGTPLIQGILRPGIILPDIDFTERELQQIFSHELMHFKRRDTWLKGIFIFINAIHWFNPLAYMARSDIDNFCELSCDEIIVKSMDARERGDYCKLILNILWKSIDQKTSLSSAFSSQQKKLERRIGMIIKGRSSKNRKWVSVFAVAITAAMVLVGTIIAYAANDGNYFKSDDIDIGFGVLDTEYARKDANLNTEELKLAQINNGSNEKPEHDGLLTENYEELEILDNTSLDFDPMSQFSIGSSSLAPNHYTQSDSSYYVTSKDKIQFSANWSPVGQKIQIGFVSPDGSNQYWTSNYSGGSASGTVTAKNITAGEYYVAIGTPSSNTTNIRVNGTFEFVK